MMKSNPIYIKQSKMRNPSPTLMIMVIVTLLLATLSQSFLPKHAYTRSTNINTNTDTFGLTKSLTFMHSQYIDELVNIRGGESHKKRKHKSRRKKKKKAKRKSKTKSRNKAQAHRVKAKRKKKRSKSRNGISKTFSVATDGRIKGKSKSRSRIDGPSLRLLDGRDAGGGGRHYSSSATVSKKVEGQIMMKKKKSRRTKSIVGSRNGRKKKGRSVTSQRPPSQNTRFDDADSIIAIDAIHSTDNSNPKRRKKAKRKSKAKRRSLVEPHDNRATQMKAVPVNSNDTPTLIDDSMRVQESLSSPSTKKKQKHRKKKKKRSKVSKSIPEADEDAIHVSGVGAGIQLDDTQEEEDITMVSEKGEDSQDSHTAKKKRVRKTKGRKCSSSKTADVEHTEEVVEAVVTVKEGIDEAAEKWESESGLTKPKDASIVDNDAASIGSELGAPTKKKKKKKSKKRIGSRNAATLEGVTIDNKGNSDHEDTPASIDHEGTPIEESIEATATKETIAGNAASVNGSGTIAEQDNVHLYPEISSQDDQPHHEVDNSKSALDEYGEVEEVAEIQKSDSDMIDSAHDESQEKTTDGVENEIDKSLPTAGQEISSKIEERENAFVLKDAAEILAMEREVRAAESGTDTASLEKDECSDSSSCSEEGTRNTEAEEKEYSVEERPASSSDDEESTDKIPVQEGIIDTASLELEEESGASSKDLDQEQHSDAAIGEGERNSDSRGNDDSDSSISGDDELSDATLAPGQEETIDISMLEGEEGSVSSTSDDASTSDDEKSSEVSPAQEEHSDTAIGEVEDDSDSTSDDSDLSSSDDVELPEVASAQEQHSDTAIGEVEEGSDSSNSSSSDNEKLSEAAPAQTQNGDTAILRVEGDSEPSTSDDSNSLSIDTEEMSKAAPAQEQNGDNAILEEGEDSKSSTSDDSDSSSSDTEEVSNAAPAQELNGDTAFLGVEIDSEPSTSDDSDSSSSDTESEAAPTREQNGDTAILEEGEGSELSIIDDSDSSSSDTVEVSEAAPTHEQNINTAILEVEKDSDSISSDENSDDEDSDSSSSDDEQESEDSIRAQAETSVSDNETETKDYELTNEQISGEALSTRDDCDSDSDSDGETQEVPVRDNTEEGTNFQGETITESEESEGSPVISGGAVKIILDKTREASEASSEESVDVNQQVHENSRITCSVVTWNLAESSPSEDEAAFIKQFRETKGSGSDFVIFGSQETENSKPRRAEGSRSKEIRRLLIKMLGKKYVPLALHSLGGVQFALFCKRSILGDLEHVSIADVACGIGNVFHNKGAIGAFVQMKARNGSDTKGMKKKKKSVKMLFVTCHLVSIYANCTKTSYHVNVMLTIWITVLRLPT